MLYPRVWVVLVSGACHGVRSSERFSFVLSLFGSEQVTSWPCAQQPVKKWGALPHVLVGEQGPQGQPLVQAC